MRHASETVLRGHPDKLCDQIADHIVALACQIDPDAYAQIEAAIWSDQVFLTGFTATRTPFDTPLAEGVRNACLESGHTPGSAIDPSLYQVHDHVCRQTRDPREWTRHVNDQTIVTGWAGYDAKTRYLPPEHFLAHTLRNALDHACSPGQPLQSHGPDGKIAVIIDETPSLHGRPDSWQILSVLTTMQQHRRASFAAFQQQVVKVITATLRRTAAADPRWRFDPLATRILVNPNGPFIEGGSNSDNGQTGRKLVMDYYGPRIPIGGGALSGKDPSHIDRAAACAARKACVDAVAAGAREASVRLTYAPGIPTPLDVTWSFPAGGRPPEHARFDFPSITTLTRNPHHRLTQSARGTHFFNPKLPWNRKSPQVEGLTVSKSERCDWNTLRTTTISLPVDR